MYFILIVFHSIFRWLVLASLSYAIYRSYTGYYKKRTFTDLDNTIRHWTATIAHIQLMLGILLYTKSAVIVSFFKGNTYYQALFFAIIHAVIMLLSIVLITIGSAKAKRRATDREKFITMLVWFSIALMLIFIAIPWPFSPLASRPLIRTF